MLVVRRAQPGNYKVTWGGQSKTFSHQQLAHGVNLAEAFPINPFSDAFAKVDAAIAAKQAFETKQIIEMFRSSEAKTDMEAVAATSEQEHQKLVDAIRAVFVPVTHTLTIEGL
jgi:hypothetical protein